MNRNPDVDALLAALDHPLKEAIVRLREVVLASDPRITELIKWNAPSFCWNGADRVTMKYQPPKSAGLVFHRGVKKVDAPLVFEDSSGLLTWVAPDRAVATFRSLDEIEANLPALQALVRAWMLATA